MITRLGNDHESPKHISFIITDSQNSPKDFRASLSFFKDPHPPGYYYIGMNNQQRKMWLGKKINAWQVIMYCNQNYPLYSDSLTKLSIHESMILPVVTCAPVGPTRELTQCWHYHVVLSDVPCDDRVMTVQ